MSHDSHSTNQSNGTPTVPFRSSFWLVVILVGLFIAAVNFVSIMSHDDGGHDTEHVAPAHGGGHDHDDAATSHDTEHHENETPATEEQHH